MSHGSHEKTDAYAKPLVIAAVVMVVFILACMMFGVVYFKTLDKAFKTDLNAYKPKDVYGSPKLQLSGSAELHSFRETETELLNSYGWVNREAGIARVPIERAMGYMLTRGELKTAEK